MERTDITYKQFMPEYTHIFLEMQHEWADERITFGLVPDTEETVGQYINDYFLLAFKGGEAVGFTTSEINEGNEYNIFPLGARYLEICNLYVRRGFRDLGIGAGLLGEVEKRAAGNGIIHFFLSSATVDADAVRRFYTRQGYGIWTTYFYKRAKTDARIYDAGFLKFYRYVVIFAKYRGKWLYSRHRRRGTWETAGGRIERGESPLDAARRELFEETGALDFDIRPLFDYSVHTPAEFSNGQVFFADVRELGPLPESEMCEVMTCERYPEKLTYPDILPLLFERVERVGGETKS